MRENEPLTAEIARATWDYDPETGVLTWLVAPCNVVKVGDVAGRVNFNGYVIFIWRGLEYRVHRVAFLIVVGRWPDPEVDHRDLDKANNRWANLREATPKQNRANVAISSRNTSGRRGASFDKAYGRWKASLFEGRKCIRVAFFDTVDEAGDAYDAWARELRGEFARP